MQLSGPNRSGIEMANVGDRMEGRSRHERRSRTFDVDCGYGVRAALSHYPSRSTQPRHRHDYAQVSFLLAGSMEECLRGTEYRLHGAGVGYKPPGSWHADAWGESGALIFSLKLTPDQAEARDAAWLPGWSMCAIASWMPSLLRTCLEGETEATRADAAEDVLATMSMRAPVRPSSRPPPWLEAVRQQVMEVPELLAIEEAARSAGVHRVHLCRLFARFYGAPPSVLRRRVLAARAIAGAARTTCTLAAVAQDAGFSDQPHMTRTVRAQAGFTPWALRALLRP
jgi:AraC-like DNA-binding protein